MELSKHYEKIISAFERFLSSLDKLCLHIQDNLREYPVWIDNDKGKFIADRDKAIYVLKHLFPHKNLLPQETFSCPGAIAATSKTLKLVQKVNNHKDQFKKAVQDYKNAMEKKNIPGKPARQILASAGYGGIKLMQVYRHIPYINFHPRRIAWTKAKKGSHKIITKSQAKALLLKIRKADEEKEGKHIAIQLSQLSSLKATEKLVMYRALKPHWGINIASFKKENGSSHFLRIREASLPLFYVHHKALPVPDVCFSNKNNRSDTGKRADKQLEEMPFLKSIRAYRYKT